MINRDARNQMAEALRSYMREQITAFQLDDAITAATDAGNDETVRQIGRTLWYFYDDLKDHKVVADKGTWDLFNRMLLLLESDEELEATDRRVHWHPLQLVGAGLFGWFMVLAWRAGFENLIVYTLPFGPPSLLLAWLNRWRRERAKGTTQAAAWVEPFPSVSRLMRARRRVAGFVRERYPATLAASHIRDPFTTVLINFPVVAVWCMFSPVPMFFQMLPECRSIPRLQPQKEAPTAER